MHHLITVVVTKEWRNLLRVLAFDDAGVLRGVIGDAGADLRAALGYNVDDLAAVKAAGNIFNSRREQVRFFCVSAWRRRCR